MMQVGNVLCHVSTCQKPECAQRGRCCATLDDEAEFTGADFSRRTDVANRMAEIEALLKDAERYRWLRDNERSDVRIIGVGKRSGADLDSTVDACVLGAA